MKICLYDWNHGGHHPAFLRLFAEALAPGNEVVVAASEPTIAEFGEMDVRTFSLGTPRPRPYERGSDGEPRLVHDKAELAGEDLSRLRRAVAEIGPDQVGVLYGDPILRWLVRSDPLGIPINLLLHFPRFHYPSRFDTPLTARERASARFQQALAARWRRRSDAQTLFTVDPVAADLWNRRPSGWAPAHCVREPPIPDSPARAPDSSRSGAMIFGYIDERKGIDRIAEALGQGAEGLELLIAGRNAPEFRDELDGHIETLRHGGVGVERLAEVDHRTALTRIGSSSCVVLAFGLVPAASRVLLEAATMGTPVVAPDWGLIGHLVRSHGLGVVVDPHDPAAIREAILEMVSDPTARNRYADAQRAYVEHCSWSAFAATIRSGFGVPPV